MNDPRKAPPAPVGKEGVRIGRQLGKTDTNAAMIEEMQKAATTVQAPLIMEELEMVVNDQEEDERLARHLCEASGDSPDDFFLGYPKWHNYLAVAQHHIAARDFFAREQEMKEMNEDD